MGPWLQGSPWPHLTVRPSSVTGHPFSIWRIVSESLKCNIKSIRLCFEIRNLLVQFAAKSIGRKFHAFSSTTWKSAALGGTCLFQLHWNSVRFFLLQAWLFGHYHEWMARNWFKSLCTCSLLDLVYYNEKQTIKKMLSKIHKPFLKVNTPYWFVKFVIALKFRVSRCSQGS